eukprot:TRINITY_DN2067_c0_g1_i2.p1 TRINITY_DN2067_c0_g1~~TRINITY_DN2067_c0_g1_i2.p1  ORF type:complete len:730 (+),score=119.79 TRINITY_DN2067_c0_g1_i2:1480-3669(+)
MLDYGQMMQAARKDTLLVQRELLEAMLRKRGAPAEHVEFFSLYELGQSPTSLDVQTTITVSATSGFRAVVVFNSLAQDRVDVVHLRVNTSHVSVLTSDYKQVASQVSPSWQFERSSTTLPTIRPASDSYILSFFVHMAPLGVSTFYLTFQQSWASAAEPDVSIWGQCQAPAATFVQKQITVGTSQTVAKISNHFLSVGINSAGLFSSVSAASADHAGVGFAFEESFSYYDSTSSQSGVYIFRPGPLVTVSSDRNVIAVVRGAIFDEVTCWFGAWDIMRRARLYHSADRQLGDFIEVVENVFVLQGELVTRFTTPQIDHRGTFFTDLNGFSFTQRTFRTDLPVSASYFPVTSTLYWQDSDYRVSVHTAHALGASCQTIEGLHCEFMLDRAGMRDDGKGLGFSGEINPRVEHTFRITIERIAKPTSHPPTTSLFSRQVGAGLQYPLVATVGQLTNEGAALVKWAEVMETALYPMGLVQAFTPDTHLLSLTAHGANTTALTAVVARYAVDSALAPLLNKRPDDDSGEPEEAHCPAFTSWPCLGAGPSGAQCTAVYADTLASFDGRASGRSAKSTCVAPMGIRSFTFDVKCWQSAVCVPTAATLWQMAKEADLRREREAAELPGQQPPHDEQQPYIQQTNHQQQPPQQQPPQQQPPQQLQPQQLPMWWVQHLHAIAGRLSAVVYITMGFYVVLGLVCYVKRYATTEHTLILLGLIFFCNTALLFYFEQGGSAV